MFDPQSVIQASGPLALLVICAIIFAETGLLVGVVLPGDTLLFFTGVLTFSSVVPQPLPVVIGAVAVAAILGDQLGYLIGRRAGPAVFSRRQAGLISAQSLARTTDFFERYGAATVTLARFVPVVRTVAPVAAGTGRMPYRRFIAFNAIGGILWPVLFIVAGYLLAQVPGVADFVSQYLDLILISVVAISIGGLVVGLLRRRRTHGRTAEQLDT